MQQVSSLNLTNEMTRCGHMYICSNEVENIDFPLKINVSLRKYTELELHFFFYICVSPIIFTGATSILEVMELELVPHHYQPTSDF